MASPRVTGSGAARFRSPPFSAGRTVRHGAACPPKVLLTGFGPFPGVASNASADLAVDLARLARQRHAHVRFAWEVLPVDWAKAPLALVRLLERHQPTIVLHFGVSARASGFVIETLAHNAAATAPDESGRFAPSPRLIAGDRPQRTATVPVRLIMATLSEAGYPARLSNDPGRYLCNAVMFHSLKHAVATQPRTRSGFIHIPATLGSGVQGEPAKIGWNDALDGGLRVIDVCLSAVPQTIRTLAR